MRLTKHTHACVRLDDGDHHLVIDPGEWSEAAALDGVAAVLVTHEHVDHLDVERLRAARAADPAFTVWASAGAAVALGAHGGGDLDGVVTVSPGDAFTAGGFEVTAVGGAHAEIYEGLPGCDNVGFVIGGAGGVYHPGDSLHVPAVDVATLLVPLAAPWLKLAEAVDFVRAVRPQRAHPIHDAMLSDRGLAGFDNWLRMKGSTAYARLAPGESVSL
jgi:L-ascorbate metabolism protein UlaG (beta-lactamase superfamily)